MATIVSCSCGAKIRLPDNAAGQSFRCPKCKIEIEVIRPAHPPPAPARAAGPVAPWSAPATSAGRTTGEICPICQSPVGAEEQTQRCPNCQQVHHRECWAEVGGCSTYGCAQAPVAD